jgi:3-methyl-2-oxobutanoate hydroxymethyltransferase
VLVWHDLLGLSAGHVPQFVKRYADLSDLIGSALSAYVSDVRAARFPETRHTYAMLPGEVELFRAELAGTSGRRGP